ncbi:MAG: hypothetical protein ACLGQH_08380 [Acidobacteriota bacterium]
MSFFNIDMAAAKDKSLSKLLLSAAKPFLNKYGEVLNLAIDSAARTLTVEVLPVGEREAVQVELVGYHLTTDETGRGWLSFERLSTSRQWLTLVAEKALPERRIKLPSGTPMAMLQAML